MILQGFIDKSVNTASGRKVVIFLLPSLAIYFVMLFYSIPIVQSYAPGLQIFDLLPGGYSHDYALKLLTALGDNGRSAYLQIQLPLDFIYPALFAVSSFLLLTWVFSRIYTRGSRIFYLGLVPVCAGILDYLENAQIIAMIYSYPDVSRLQVLISSTTTMAKSGLTSIFFLLLIFGFIRLWTRSRPEQ